jgi:hypothetical protein
LYAADALASIAAVIRRGGRKSPREFLSLDRSGQAQDAKTPAVQELRLGSKIPLFQRSRGAAETGAVAKGCTSRLCRLQSGVGSGEVAETRRFASGDQRSFFLRKLKRYCLAAPLDPSLVQRQGHRAVQSVSELSEESRELVITTGKTESGDVLVAVRDSGPGLVPAALEHLFEAFHTTKPNGLGLGCRSAARSSKGTTDACGRAPTHRAAPSFNLPCPPNQTLHRVSDVRRYINEPRRRRISKDAARKSISLVAMLLKSQDKPSRSRPFSTRAITTDPK